MTKGELISTVASKANITNAQASAAVSTVFNAIESSLKDGDKASFVGFGTFSVGHRPEREGRNPRTGEPMTFAAKNTIKFKAGKGLVEAVNA